jgi:hypothetical protein
VFLFSVVEVVVVVVAAAVAEAAVAARKPNRAKGGQPMAVAVAAKSWRASTPIRVRIFTLLLVTTGVVSLVKSVVVAMWLLPTSGRPSPATHC